MSFINDFTSLTPSARRDFLHHFVPQLTSQEWRDLQATLCKRTFQLDIVGSLPVELVLNIFGHLDIATPIRCQRVCKRWRRLFDDVSVITSLLATFYTPHDPPSAGEDGLDQKSLQTFRARRLLAFQRGLPSSTRDYAEYPPRAEFPTRSYDLHSDTLAWIDSTRPTRALWSQDARGAQVACLNFRTGVKLVCRADGHEMILCMVLTSQIVGFVTYTGMCYACNLSTYAKRSLHLPSANIRLFGGRSAYLAIIQGGWSAGHTVALWDTTSNTTHSFTMPDCWERTMPRHPITITEDKGNFHGLLVAPNGQSVVVFARISSTKNNFQFARYSTCGDVLSRGSIQSSMMPRDFRSFPISPYNNNGLFTIRMEVGASKDKLPDAIILFDENKDVFITAQHPFANISPLRPAHPVDTNYVAACLWKNFVIYTTETSTRLFVEPLSQRHVIAVRLPPRPHESTEPLTSHSGTVNSSEPLKRSDLFTVIGNDRFVVVFDSRMFPGSYRELESLRVYCFEPNIALPERWDVQYSR